MAAYKAGPVTFGGTPAHELLLRLAADLERAVVAELAEQLPVYGALPTEHLHGDVARIVRLGLSDFAAALGEGRLPDDARVASFRDSAARRAEEGLPLDAVVNAYFIGARVILAGLVGAAGPPDPPGVNALHGVTLEYLRLVTGAVSSGYVQELQTSAGERHGVRQQLLAGLLAGDPARAAQETGADLPAEYAVLGLVLGPHPDESRPGVDPSVAARRKLRRVRTALDHHSRGASLHTLTADGGLVLLPYDGVPGAGPGGEAGAAPAVVARLRQAAGAPVTAAVLTATPAAVVDAAPVAAELAALAVASGRPQGLYRLADLALDHQLSRPGPAADHLASLLRPLEERPELMATLRAYLGAACDRQVAATRLRVHPNTVLYRLRKVAELTGLNPARATDLPTLHAALACRARR
ncbi:PucR family transcriptional regulator [Streptomyces sp. NPDC090994]|uniref:PucR family transcriptional regulator n=1 Tax=Streptomyces sp. NPDC090994 TaxID=3365969 RepID=UPI0038277B44